MSKEPATAAYRLAASFLSLTGYPTSRLYLLGRTTCMMVLTNLELFYRIYYMLPYIPWSSCSTSSPFLIAGMVVQA
jgi:hypothetical protein